MTTCIIVQNRLKRTWVCGDSFIARNYKVVWQYVTVFLIMTTYNFIAIRKNHVILLFEVVPTIVHGTYSEIN